MPCCLVSVMASLNAKAIVFDPFFLYSFLSIWILVWRLRFIIAVDPMRKGGGELCHGYTTHYAVSISPRNARNAPRRIYIAHVPYGIYASIHPAGPSDIHRCAQWRGKWGIKRPHNRPLRVTQGQRWCKNKNLPKGTCHMHAETR